MGVVGGLEEVQHAVDAEVGECRGEHSIEIFDGPQCASHHQVVVRIGQGPEVRGARCIRNVEPHVANHCHTAIEPAQEVGREPPQSVPHEGVHRARSLTLPMWHAVGVLDRLEWIGGEPTSLALEGGRLSVACGPLSDWFSDPRGAAPNRDAPLGLLPAFDLPAVIEVRAEVALNAMFDAAALFVFYDEAHWLKFALERSPQGEATLVTVRTEGSSDDANHRVVANPSYLLRAAIDSDSVALHASADRTEWELLRYCSHPSPLPPRIGLSVQSPVGRGTRATFSELVVEHRVIEDLRNGE